MTLDKFGRHIEHHKTKKYTSKVLSLKQIEEIELKYTNKINNFQIELFKIKNSLKSITIINLKLKLQGDVYHVVNSFNSSFYTLPCTGKIIEVNLNNAKEYLNYRINNNPRVNNLINKHVVKGDKLTIYPGPVSLKTTELYMEIVLEASVYYVEN